MSPAFKQKISLVQWNMGCTKKTKPDVVNNRMDVLLEILNAHSPDFATLQEIPMVELSRVLASGYSIQQNPRKVALLTKDSTVSFLKKFDTTKNYALSIHASLVNHPAEKFFVTSLHLPTLNISDEAKRSRLINTVTQIRTKYASIGNNYLLFGGDFNLPPYEPWMILKEGFYSNRSLEHVKKLSTNLLNQERALYNPTWKIFGGNANVLGTYYLEYEPHGPWHILDQVLVDPKLLISKKESIQVLCSIGSKNLLTRYNRPSKTNGSDHLPLLFEMI